MTRPAGHRDIFIAHADSGLRDAFTRHDTNVLPPATSTRTSILVWVWYSILK